jgi:hypothetical protein
MEKRALGVTGMVAGAFLIHCGQGAVHDLLGDGGVGDGAFVGDSMAAGEDMCCTPPETPPPVVIFDGMITPNDTGGDCYSPEWSIAGMQSVTLHVDRCSSAAARIQYRLGAAGFVEQQTGAGDLSCTPGTTILFQPNPALGNTIRIRFPDYGGGDGMACVPRNVTLVGIRR